MSHRTPRYNIELMGPHARRGVQQNHQGRIPPAHPDAFHGEIGSLSFLLAMEKAGRYEDHQRLAHQEAELEESKVQLKRQEALKDMFINQDKDAKRDLERVEKLNEPAVLNAAVTASKVHNNVKPMKKKPLQQDFAELKEAHLLTQESFVAEIQREREKSKGLQKEIEALQALYEEQRSKYEAEVGAEIQHEKEKSKGLQEEMEALQTSYEEQRSKYEAEVALVRQEAQTKKVYEERIIEAQRLLENESAEKDQMLQEMSQKIDFLQDNEKLLQDQLNEMKRSYDELNGKYESDVSAVQQDMETYRLEMTDEIEANLAKENGNVELIKNLKAEKKEIFENMSRNITIMRKREKQILNELDQVFFSFEELKRLYETDVIHLQQQNETYRQRLKQQESTLSNRDKKEKLLQERRFSVLQQQVEKLQQQIKEERKSHQEKSEEDLAILHNIRAENAVLLEKTRHEIKILQEKVSSTQDELQKADGSYKELSCQYETEITALKQQTEQYEQQVSCLKDDLERARQDLLLPDLLREGEDGSLEKEENSLSQLDLVHVLSQEVSSEEELSGGACSTEPEFTEEISGETGPQDLDHPHTDTMQDGEKRKSKFSIWKKIRSTLRLKKSKKPKERRLLEKEQDVQERLQADNL